MMYRCRILIAIILSLAIIASCFVLTVSADTVESWLLLLVQYSNDNNGWSSEEQLPIVNGLISAGSHQSYQYMRINGIYILNTSNKPSDLWFSFAFHPGALRVVSSDPSNNSGTIYTGESPSATINQSSMTGYARGRSIGQAYFNVGSDSVSSSTFGTYFLGQVHINDVTSSAYQVRFNAPVVYRMYNVSGVTPTNLQWYSWIDNINISFVGEQSQLYDILEQSITTYNLLNGWRSDFNLYVTAFDDFVSGPFSDFYSDFLTFSDNFTTFVNTNFYVLQRRFELLANTTYRYKSISYDTTGLSVVTENTANWWTAILGNTRSLANYFAQQALIDNYAVDAGAYDALDDAYDADPDFSTLDDFSGLGSISSWSASTASSQGNDGILAWFSSSTKSDLDQSGGVKGDDGYIDFYLINVDSITQILNDGGD